ncbi:MAG: diguanylate cyclase, partial [Planctomycetales bacterium]|nr:diguanylate cyclase [Planctomycetales bacterium]
TSLERKREELAKTLSELRVSRDELTTRNKELQYLATRDSLTGCLNRRTFFEIFDEQWKLAHRHQHPLSCLMIDVDHFKSVNDNHGHAMGDEVLKQVAATIQKMARKGDVPCRYGGEEFCMLLPNTDIAGACEVAERIRQAIEQLEFSALSITASLGGSSISLGANAPQELLDQADKCLYVAKRSGRNRVICWDEVPGDIANEESTTERDDSTQSEAVENTAIIPYPAVTALVSALTYRDAETAAHSMRVAELAVATASGLVSVKDTYVIEVAALLHDIGKIGVPDEILLKPGPLSRKEWETMERHDRIGVEIVEAAFANQQLIDIVRFHHAMYGGSPDAPGLPCGGNIPIGARIVTIADAYDAIVSDRVYRKGRSPEEAFQELRRCAGRQFDPELVERFIGVVVSHRAIPRPFTSKQTALQLGLQIEHLAAAIDNQDSRSIKALAARLESTAACGGIPEIESLAAEIRQVADDENELVSLLQMVGQLMGLCRSVQKIHTETDEDKQVLRGVPGVSTADSVAVHS